MKENTRREIAIMEEFLEGKRIQVSIKGGQWLDTPIPAWDWGFCDYRVVNGAKRKPFSAGMIREAKTRDYIEIMRAYLQGKSIQCSSWGLGKSEWIDIDCPVWNWGAADYRVKPEK